jgi:hypothetical protein
MFNSRFGLIEGRNDNIRDYELDEIERSNKNNTNKIVKLERSNKNNTNKIVKLENSLSWKNWIIMSLIGYILTTYFYPNIFSLIPILNKLK